MATVRTLVDWIRQLGFLVFFAGLVQILLPDNDLRKTARLVIGLVFVLAVIEPMVAWLDGAWLLDEAVGAGAGGWFSSGESYVREGERLAADVLARAQDEWRLQAERELAALIALVPGVKEVEVTVSMGDGEVSEVGVRLIPAVGRGDETTIGHDADGQVRRLIQAFLPGVTGERIRVAWVEEGIAAR